MSFPSEVKEQAFVACARHCCVCKKFKGRNVEVHHIVQKSDGGEDTFENAIPLCFDCHADAGHYNPRHPRGSKFSPNELRRHRDAWYEIIREGRHYNFNLEISSQFFLTDCFSIVWEIVKGNFSSFPIDGVKVVRNRLFDFLASACEFQKDFDRENMQTLANYRSLEEFLSKYPDAKLTETQWGVSYWERGVAIEELKRRYFDKDFVTNCLIRYGAPSTAIADATFMEICCGAGNEEWITLRKAKVAFLVVINSSNTSVKCHTLKGRFSSAEELSYVDAPLSEDYCVDLKEFVLEPGEGLLIPSYLVLSPIRGREYVPDTVVSFEKLSEERHQETRKIVAGGFNAQETIGPRYAISSIQFSTENEAKFAEFKPLRTDNLLMISRYWQVGSCPHLFLYSELAGAWEYAGELFDGIPSVSCIVTLPFNLLKRRRVALIKIVELEDEITTIDYIEVDGVRIYENVVLEKFEELVVRVSNPNEVKIAGRYELKSNINYWNRPLLKQQKIFHALADMNR